VLLQPEMIALVRVLKLSADWHRRTRSKSPVLLFNGLRRAGTTAAVIRVSYLTQGLAGAKLTNWICWMKQN